VVEVEKLLMSDAWMICDTNSSSFSLPLSGSLLPSHGLPPFGANITNIAMSEGLCGTSMFSSERWGVGVNPMTAGNYLRFVYFALSLGN
jgi:hypothetical protein